VDESANHAVVKPAINGNAPVRRRPRPPMVRAELLGQHNHQTICGRKVQIWKRGEKILARGRHRGRQFGKGLGTDVSEAASNLRRLLVEIENGSFEPPSEARKRPIPTGQAPRLTMRELCSRFIAEKRQLRGKSTAGTFQSRLVPLIEFSEQPETRRCWPLAMSVDRQFAIRFRTQLFARQITPNGHPGSVERNVSPRQVLNILDGARSLFHWARRPEVNQLPSAFVNPFTKEIVGEKVRKDPLRPVVFPLERRIALVPFMDHWELCQFAIAFVLPLRCEDYAGLLISEVDYERCLLRFGTRFGGRDFNKGRQSFVCPFPQELELLLRACAGGRADGPLLRKRSVWEGRRQPRLSVAAPPDVAAHVEATIRDAKPMDVQTNQDLKRLIRSVLLDMGGVSEDGLAKAFKSLVARASLVLPAGARFYDLRGSCTTDLEQSGVSHLVQRYVTGHTTSDILSEYVSLDPVGQMPRYFSYIKPLLDAIQRRATELGIPNANSKAQ